MLPSVRAHVVQDLLGEVEDHAGLRHVDASIASSVARPCSHLIGCLPEIKGHERACGNGIQEG